MTDYSLEDRIKRRLLVEGMPQTEDIDGLTDWPLFGDLEWDGPENAWVKPLLAAHIAALEAEDTANPIAATAIVRKDAVTEINPPDVEELLAAFNRPEED